MSIILLFFSFYVQLYIGCKLRNCKFYIDIQSFCVILSVSIFYDQLLRFQVLHSYKIVITTVFLMGILLLRIEKNILTLMQTTFFTVIIMISSESIIGAFMVNVLNIRMETAHESKIILILLNIFVYSMSILVANSKDLLCRLIHTDREIHLTNTIINNIFLVTVFTIFTAAYILAYKSFIRGTFYIVFMFSMFCIIITGIFLYKSYMLKLKEEKFNELSLYTNIVEGLVDDVSKFKHDYNNILFMMRGYLEENNIEGLKNFFNAKISEDYSYNEIPKLKKIKDAGLRGLLTSKIVQAHSENINTSIEILDFIDCFNINMIDLCRIIGILIDNAREAARESDNKFICISFSQKDYLNITIANSYSATNNINIDKIYKKNYSTKGKNRGIGLSNVKEIINKKYPNILLNTYIQEDLFIQDLYIGG